MLDWAKLLSEKIETAESTEIYLSVPEADLFLAIIAETVATFDVHDSVTDDELEAVFAEIVAIQEKS